MIFLWSHPFSARVFAPHWESPTPCPHPLPRKTKPPEGDVGTEGLEGVSGLLVLRARIRYPFRFSGFKSMSISSSALKTPSSVRAVSCRSSAADMGVFDVGTSFPPPAAGVGVREGRGRGMGMDADGAPPLVVMEKEVLLITLLPAAILKA